MPATLDYNRPEVIDAFKPQLIAQHELDKVAEQIITGREGGLAYLLIGADETGALPFPTTHIQRKLTMEYCEAIGLYVASARDFSMRQERNFRLLTATKVDKMETRWVIGTPNEDSPVGSLCIGYTSIDSRERMVQFYEEIKRLGYTHVDDQLKQVQAIAERLKGAFKSK